jgi:hypothetical protein
MCETHSHLCDVSIGLCLSLLCCCSPTAAAAVPAAWQVYMANLAMDATDDHIKDFCEKMGQVRMSERYRSVFRQLLITASCSFHV